MMIYIIYIHIVYHSVYIHMFMHTLHANIPSQLDKVNPRGEVYGGAERNFHCVPVGDAWRKV